MANVKLTGRGSIADADYRYVQWIGTTKGGQAVKITLKDAICLSNPDWTFAEKDDVTAEVEFSAVYDDAKLATGDRTEPWEVEYPDGTTAGAGEIILRAGKFYVGTSSSDAACVGLTRGGGSFVVERTPREINGDDDPGPVKGRIDFDECRPKLKFTALEWLTKTSNLYAGIIPVT